MVRKADKRDIQAATTSHSMYGRVMTQHVVSTGIWE
jgi:hypothetical protein